MKLGVIADPHLSVLRDAQDVSPLSWPEVSAVPVFRAAGLGLHVHEVLALSDRQVEPFDVRFSQ